MDESWRISIGSTIPRRRSTEQPRRIHRPESETLDADDFRDVFGGPPRTILLRQFSGDFSAGEIRPTTFYDEVFRPAEYGFPARNGRNLPGFRIPAARGVMTEEGFYDDIFGSDGGDRPSRSRSKSKSKSNTSSVLSSEDLSPLRPSIAEDTMLSLASKLRPITIPSRRYDSSPPSTISGGEQNNNTLTIPCPPRSSFMDFQFTDNPSNRSKSHIGFSCQISPPEPISVEPNFRRSLKPWADNSDAGSPSSVISLACHIPIAIKARANENFNQVGGELEKLVVEAEEEERSVESSFVIEIDNHGIGENEGAAAVDEAIAWAKERFWNPMSKGLEVGNEQHDTKERKEEKGKGTHLQKMEECKAWVIVAPFN